MIKSDVFILVDDQRHIGLIPSQLESPISVEAVGAALALSDYSHCLINRKALENLVEYVNRGCQDDSSNVPFVIGERIDASLDLKIADDGMLVKAIIVTAQGGHHITLPALIDKLHEDHVSFGLQTQGTLQFLKDSSASDPGVRMEAVIALGRAAEHGKNAQFKRLVQTPKERLLRPQPMDHGRVDMRNLGQMCSVKVGDILMRKLPCTEGKDGKNIYGEVLPSRSGEDAQLVVGEGACISADDPNLLVAQRVGLPMEIERGMRVDELLAMKEVNVATGHVVFAGSIIINGDVREDMKVIARGDIHVLGYVDSAYLEAGGDILVEKGIIGHRRPDGQLSCELKAIGSIRARNAQYSHLSAEKDILITRELNHCLVKSLQRVIVGDENNYRGLMVGGEIYAGNGVETVVAGSEAGPNTYVVLEGLYEALYDNKHILTQHYEQLHRQLDELMNAQLASAKIADPAKRVEMQSKITATINHHHESLVQVEEELTANQQALDLCLSNSQLKVKKKMFGNIHFKLAGQEIVSDREYGPTQTLYQNSELKFTPL
ncbi:DUF342 domain-containing protein [Celerinatantimonas yamalensis]|uniref:FapA family protein n=1 Tax=Celerinatantimonas yamalensis TaxID=559956 RepID=A0ABW9G9D3_9GAMM